MRIKMFISVLAGVIVAVSYVHGKSASFLTACKVSDSICLKNNVGLGFMVMAKGIPELGVTPLDPMVLKKVDASIPELKLILTDLSIEGLRNCIAKDASRDLKKEKMFITFQCDSKLEGQFEMDGQLLSVPLKGKGPMHAEIKKLTIKVDLDVTVVVGKDDKKHWDLGKWTHTFELLDHVELDLETKALGTAVSDLISANAKDIVNQIGPPVIKSIMEEILNSTRNFFKNVPAEIFSIDD